MEDVLGIPTTLRLGPLRGYEPHRNLGEEWVGFGLGDGGLSPGRAALREMQELRREVSAVSSGLSHERDLREKVASDLMTEREHWQLKEGAERVPGLGRGIRFGASHEEAHEVRQGLLRFTSRGGLS